MSSHDKGAVFTVNKAPKLFRRLNQFRFRGYGQPDLSTVFMNPWSIAGSCGASLVHLVQLIDLAIRQLLSSSDFKQEPKLMSQKPNSRFALSAEADMLIHKTREKVDAGRKLCRLSQKSCF